MFATRQERVLVSFVLLENMQYEIEANNLPLLYQ